MDALYEAAKQAMLSLGLPWTDPRTGVTYHPERKNVVKVKSKLSKRNVKKAKV